jgi:hypothetical protein
MSRIQYQIAKTATNLRQGARLVGLRAVDPLRFQVSVHQLVLLLGLDLLLSITGGWLVTLPTHRFEPAGWGGWALGLVLFFFALYVMTGLLGRGADWLRAAVMAVASLFWLDLAFLLLDTPLVNAASAEHPLLAVIILIAALFWLFAVGFRIATLLGAPALGARLGASGLWLTVLLLGSMLLPKPGFWEAGDAEDPARWARYRAIDVEGVYYAQRHMVEGLVASLEPGRPGVTDLYFVGFASYATEDVFLKEVGFVQDLFDRRFGTRGRSLRLVNSLETLDRTPLANVSNLRIVLRALAEKMDVDEDVLFLYLTSHGSPEHELAIDFWPLRLNDFPAEMLKTLLDEAGIRYRVVVVSACYSGGFIDAVKDENSLIITAARPDRTSFGCGHEQDFTYFGEAYFAEALELERSFVSAYELARRLIAAREQAEGLEPSEPQMYLGPEIRSVLGALASRSPAALLPSAGQPGSRHLYAD